MLNLSPFEFDVVTVNPQGEEINRYRGNGQYYLQVLPLGITLEMIAITGGSFAMGASKTEEGWAKNQSPVHMVKVKDFLMSKYPITQAQWEAIATLPKINQELNPNPSSFSGDNNPVEQISWYDALEFCARLSELTGNQYRLPSEAEWEYAARANTTTPFHFGETITTDLANYSGVDWEYFGKTCSKGSYGQGPLGKDLRQTTPVGNFAIANQFGLYDMHGNVREWCADYWHNNYQNAPSDGSIWTKDGDSELMLLRGGSWNTAPSKCRSAWRFKLSPSASLYDIGFRVVY